MRVVHVYDGHEKVYNGRGSVPNVIWNVARETARNHDVTVLERKWRGLDVRAEYDGVRFERFDLRTGADEPWERVPYEAIESPIKLARLVCDRVNFARVALSRVDELDPDIVHVHLPFAANVLVTVAPSLREKTVYTAHLGELRMNALADDQRGNAATSDGDTSEDESGSGLDAPAVLDFVSPDTYLANRVAHTTVLNPDIADVFADRGVSRDQLSVVPNGVDVERFGEVDDERKRAVRDSYDIDDGPTVFFVGTVMPRKGVDDLVRATSRLVDAGYDDLRVIVAGEDDLDGEYAAEIQELADAEGVGDLVTLAGFVPSEDLPPLYAAADAFVLPSREEGFGMTVTEAMAAGTPVVATDVGGISRLVDEGKQGYVVRPNDPSGLAEGIDELLSTADGESMADAARDRAAEYSWRGIATRFTDIYEEVAQR